MTSDALIKNIKSVKISNRNVSIFLSFNKILMKQGMENIEPCDQRCNLTSKVKSLV